MTITPASKRCPSDSQLNFPILAFHLLNRNITHFIYNCPRISVESSEEDVDLAWRAQLYGWRSIYTPDAIAYHVRSFRPGKRLHLATAIRRDAVKNRWLMNFKNDLPLLMLQDLPYILGYELRVLAYLILFEQSSLPAIWDFIRLLPQMRRRRHIIQRRRKSGSKAMRQWFI